MSAADVIDVGELAGVAVGSALGLGVLIAAAVALWAWIRASESRRQGDTAGMVAFGSLSLILGLAGTTGIVYGIVVIAADSPVL